LIPNSRLQVSLVSASVESLPGRLSQNISRSNHYLNVKPFSQDGSEGPQVLSLGCRYVCRNRQQRAQN